MEPVGCFMDPASMGSRQGACHCWQVWLLSLVRAGTVIVFFPACPGSRAWRGYFFATP